jgi:hypothetical protein
MELLKPKIRLTQYIRKQWLSSSGTYTNINKKLFLFVEKPFKLLKSFP